MSYKKINYNLWILLMGWIHVQIKNSIYVEALKRWPKICGEPRNRSIFISHMAHVYVMSITSFLIHHYKYDLLRLHGIQSND